MSNLERIGISLESDLLGAFDKLIESKGYPNRSEAVRDMIREQLSKHQLSKSGSSAVAAVYLVYDHHQSLLSQKLTALQHNHLLQVIVSTHVHLDHHNCLEIIILKGNMDEIEKLGSNIAALKGVKLSKISLIPSEIG